MLYTIYTALGVAHERCVDGVAIVGGVAADEQMVAIALRINADIGAFLDQNLDDPEWASLSTEQLQNLKRFQCDLITEKRSQCYKTEADPLFFGSEADGDSKQAWLDKRAEIKARYPFPGTYR